MGKWHRPRTEVVQQMRNHILALETSGRNFDLGAKWEAPRLATAVYTMVHDGGRNSKSILTQLGLRATLRFSSSVLAHIPGNLLPEHPLVMVQLTTQKIEYMPRFSDDGIRPKLVQFH
jgi:hypothetical protein